MIGFEECDKELPVVGRDSDGLEVGIAIVPALSNEIKRINLMILSRMQLWQVVVRLPSRVEKSGSKQLRRWKAEMALD